MRTDKEVKMIQMQLELQKNIDCKNYVSLENLNIIAGVDLAYWKQDGVELATCCIVLIDYKSHDIIENVEYTDKVQYDYIPGCLAFRELPLFWGANEKLKNQPDVYVFDGNGYLHPRKMGIATHAGILLKSLQSE